MQEYFLAEAVSPILTDHLERHPDTPEWRRVIMARIVEQATGPIATLDVWNIDLLEILAEATDSKKHESSINL